MQTSKKQSAASKLPGLDGLRAIAVLLVFLFHCGLLDLGWIGVQLFFVLSGYLISPQLVRMREAELPAYLRVFYGRRALRLSPLYFAFLCGLQLLTAFHVPMHGVKEGLPWAWPYLYNLYHAGADFLHSQVMTHLWSLAVEEQFYLLWPLLIFFCPPRWLRALLLAIVAMGPLLRFGQWLIYKGSPELFFSPPEIAVYVMLPSHIDAFALGALTAIFPPQHASAKLRITARLLVLGAIVLMLDAGFTPALGLQIGLAHSYGFVWEYTLLNVFGALVIDAVARRRAGASVLESGVLRYIGGISYGIYLLHFPVQSIVRKLPLFAGNPWLSTPVQLAITLLLATVSYRLLERPFLKRKDQWFPLSDAMESEVPMRHSHTELVQP